jgi:hypothetical protein
LTLAEAKQLLTTLQHYLVERQATAFVATHSQCAPAARRSASKASPRAPSGPSLARSH